MKKWLWMGIGASVLTIGLTLTSGFINKKENLGYEFEGEEENQEVEEVIDRYKEMLEFFEEDRFNFYTFPMITTNEHNDGYYFFRDRSVGIDNYFAFIKCNDQIYIQYDYTHDEDFVLTLELSDYTKKVFNDWKYTLEELSKW